MNSLKKRIRPYHLIQANQSMPHIQIKVLAGKSEEQKKQLAQEVIQAAQKVIGMENDAYSLSIEEFSQEEWKDEVYPNSIMADPKILVKKPGYSFD